MAYTLKSNATTALAKLVWVGDNVAELGHVNLVDSSAVSVVGTLATGSRGGHVSYGDGATFGNHLQATLAAIPSGTTYCYLIVGHVGKDPSTTAGGRIVQSPDAGTRLWTLTPASTRIFQATDSAAGDTPYLGPAFSPNSFPSGTVYSVIGGRTAAGKQSTIANGTEVARNTNDSYVLNHAVSAGTWKFGGSPGTATNQEAQFGVTLFAVFVGLDQNQLATYIAANGTGSTEADKAFSALLDGGPSAVTGDSSITLGAITGTASGTVSTAGSVTGSGAITLGAVGSSAAGTVAAFATFTSEPLKTNNGTLQASLALDWVRLYNVTTGALVVTKTGISTNSSGVFTFTDAALTVGQTYKADWKITTTGETRMPSKAAA